MVRISTHRKAKQGGQAVVLVILSLSVFIFGAMGLAVDGSQLYAHRQMAQSAADAAAQAGIVTILNGTTPSIGASAYYCTSVDATSPCAYARTNGFTAGVAACTSPANAAPGADCVKVDPNPGVAVTGLDAGTPNEVQVTVTRAVPLTLMKMMTGFTNLNVTARATAAIVDVTSAPPIVITHPTKSDALDTGTGSIIICGGPKRSVQVNSSNSAAWSGNVDLSHAGPGGDCSTVAGGDFGSFGGPPPPAPGGLSLGTNGRYLSPADPIQDPLAFVNPPTTAGLTTGRPQGGQPCIHCGSCPNGLSCQEYLPGVYASGIDVKNNDAIFDPGVYYLQNGGGFTTKNATVKMCPSPAPCAADATTVNGVVFYDTGTASGGCNATGGFNVSTGSDDTLMGAGILASNPGAAPAAPYYGILFFEDRNACAQSHNMGQGNGSICIIGTTYITNTLAIMRADPNQYQAVTFNGNPSGCVNVFGEIIVSSMSMVGAKDNIKMTLLPLPSVILRQIALVNGE